MAVGDGRFRGWFGFWEGRARYGDRLAAFSQLEVDLADGQHITFDTDPTWTAPDGHILRLDPWYGKHVDFRISDNAWLGIAPAKPSSTGRSMVVDALDPSSRNLIAEEVERDEQVDRLIPKKIGLSLLENKFSTLDRVRRLCPSQIAWLKRISSDFNL